APAVDTALVDAEELQRLQQILNACWQAFAEAVESASGKHLRKGPRGGGRTAAQIFDHVVEGQYRYLRRSTWREPHEHMHDVARMLQAVQQADKQALAVATSGAMPLAGPRGGTLWKPRYFVRRAAWHILDHAWEIEDKLEP